MEHTQPPTRPNRPAYAAAVWAFLFAAVSFYYAVGGTLGLETLGQGMKELALSRDPETITLVVITGFIKVLAGIFALALAQSWGRIFPRRLLLTGAYAAGILLTLYGLASMAEHALMLAGSRPIPDLLGTSDAARWHLFFWDWWWLVGGICFLLAARRLRP